MSGPVLQAPLHSPPIIQQLITKQTSPLMSFVLAWSDDLSVDLSDLISYLLKKKTEQNNNPIVKLREREGQRVDLGRSLKGHL